MSTNSSIGILNNDGSVDYIYSQRDGYPNKPGVGYVLKNYYKTEDRVRDLISGGDISYLGKYIHPEENPLAIGDVVHTFENPIDDVTVYYYRDRGEPFKISNAKDLHEYTHNNKHPAIYIYLFDPTLSEWFCWCNFGAPKGWHGKDGFAIPAGSNINEYYFKPLDNVNKIANELKQTNPIKLKKTPKVLLETGEADQDYDPEVYTEICNALKSKGYDCSHKEFDKYQGVYLDINGYRFFTANVFVTAITTGYSGINTSVLVDPDGVEYSGNKGDYFAMDDDTILYGHTLIIDEFVNGKRNVKKIKNPKVSDLPDPIGQEVLFTDERIENTIYEFYLEEEPVVFFQYTVGSKDVSQFIDVIKDL